MAVFPNEVPLPNDSIDELVGLYKSAYKKILGEIDGATDFGRANRLSIAKSIEQELTRLGVDTQRWIEREVPAAYKLGSSDATRQIVQANTYYHGGGGIKGGSLLGSGFYVTDDPEIARQFGKKLTKVSLNLKPSEILTIRDRDDLDKLYAAALRSNKGLPVEQAISKYASSKGYKVIEATKGFDDLAGINVIDKKIIAPPLALKNTFTTIDREAVKFFVGDMSNSFGDSLSAVNRSARQVFNTAAKEEIKARIAEGRITGATRKQIAAGIKQTVRDRGISALNDRAGRSWSLDRYADMLARTKLVEARNSGLANKMLQNGYDLVQVSNTGSSHAECARWEDEILSLTGETSGYPTVAEAEGDGLFHPNCQHAINAVHLDLASKTIAYNNQTGEYEGDE